jgi:hypothetical protein
MTYAPHNPDGHIFNGRPMRQIQAKWGRLSMSDLAQISTREQLIATLEERYGLPIGVAERDVEIWRLDRHL